MKDLKAIFRENVRSNISKHGHHFTLVQQGTNPRYAYTIGAHEKVGKELLFAGGIYYKADEVGQIINEIVDQLNVSTHQTSFEVGELGTFSISATHNFWSELMMLGFYTYYHTREVNAFQIIPEQRNFTLDIPEMSLPFNIDAQPVWKWLSIEWDLQVPESSSVMTNLDTLRGHKITEVSRWEDDYWEAFAGAQTDIDKKDVRLVPIATLLGIDPTLEPIFHLPVGESIWRDEIELEWQEWK